MEYEKYLQKKEKGKLGKSYTESWYFKHQADGQTLLVIPGFRIDADGRQTAFIRASFAGQTREFLFPPSQYRSRKDRMYVEIGNNIFSEKGISIHLKNGDFSLCGTLRYTGFAPIKAPLRGSFRVVPFTEYKRSMVSIYHALHGMVEMNRTLVNFRDGIGYVEKLWGSSFPRSYFWTQCGGFAPGPSCLMVSIEQVSLGSLHWQGGICCVSYGGRQYRLATHRGAQILKCTEGECMIQQGKYFLQATLLSSCTPKEVQVQNKEGIERTVHSSPCCTMRYQFYREEDPLFDVTSDCSSLEFRQENQSEVLPAAQGEK